VPEVALNSALSLRAAVRSAASCGSLAMYRRPAIIFSLLDMAVSRSRRLWFGE